MRTLVQCMTHLKHDIDCKLFRVWLELLGQQSDDPNTDLLIVDSASPIPVESVIPNPQNFRRQWLVNDDHIPQMQWRASIAKFRDALGHPYHDGVKERSGPCRAWMKGIEIAIASGYNRYVYLEADLLYAKPIAWAFDQKTKPVACGPLIDHGKFPEVGVFFADTEHLWKCDFVERYNWRGPCVPEGERRMWDILGDNLEMLPLKGDRDQWQTPPEMFARKWPDGCDYITHYRLDTAAEFLKMNGFGDLVELLA